MFEPDFHILIQGRGKVLEVGSSSRLCPAHMTRFLCEDFTLSTEIQYDCQEFPLEEMPLKH